MGPGRWEEAIQGVRGHTEKTEAVPVGAEAVLT